MAVSQRLGVDAMSRHVVCSALVVAPLTLAVCSSACVQTQDEHSPATQALANLRASAEAGDAEVQFILGGMYVTGVGVPQDAAEAVAWYRRAAEQGHAGAQYNLGGMYAEGLGVPRGAVEAHMWLTIAASRSIGAEREQMLTARAAIAARMTPTDVRDANRRAQAWHAAHQGMRNRAVPPSDTGREGLIVALGLFWSPCDGRRGPGTPLAVRRRQITPGAAHPGAGKNPEIASAVRAFFGSLGASVIKCCPIVEI